MEKKYLELVVHDYLFNKVNATSNYDIERFGFYTVDLLRAILEPKVFKNTTYNVLFERDNVLASEVCVDNTLTFICYNSWISALIINLNCKKDYLGYLYETLYNHSKYRFKDNIRKCDLRILRKKKSFFSKESDPDNYDTSIYIEKNILERNDWKRFIKYAYKYIKKHKYKEWNQIEIDNYKIITNARTVSAYGKQDTNGNILLGFNLTEQLCNYFTGDIKSKVINRIAMNYNMGNITKIVVPIADRKIAIESNSYSLIDLPTPIDNVEIANNNIDMQTIKSLINIYRDFTLKYKNIKNMHKETCFSIKHYNLYVDSHGYLHKITCEENRNIQFENKDGSIIDLDKLVLKMKILGVDTYKDNSMGDIKIKLDSNNDEYEIELLGDNI